MSNINISGSYVQNSQIGTFTGSNTNNELSPVSDPKAHAVNQQILQPDKLPLQAAWKNLPVVNACIQILRALHVPI
ncbi:hypothetical protein HNR00_001481 [Methylorubrum rhodinum]|uniref:Uncharacterized protein n=1 Tax=Methylorubrum rhodinum TaxID=29428 RepID=A0A840ZIG3_9HYPH|nr:hypothetical protein [Methylorubrum rhodinum]MBB5756781.1 hypothetical protein [Methylorubrum rhodinum]